MSLLPRSASTFAPQVDAIALALLALCTLIALVVFGLIILFATRYRQGAVRNRVTRPGGQTLIEWSWTVATLGVFLGIYAWGATVYFKMHAPPADATEISVVGKQWMWKFQHADGHQELAELHVPVGQPILLTMTSQDVIHSLFIPAFRIKQDLLPGRYEHVWFQATEPGEYDIYCSQYCGTDHSLMRAKLVALSPNDYQRWLQTGAAPVVRNAVSPVSRGKRLYARTGCAQCHDAGASDDLPARCPSLIGLFGRAVTLADGSVVTADENYLRESIVEPSAKITAGYADRMPSYRGQLGEEELSDLIAYLKSLSTTPPGALHAEN